MPRLRKRHLRLRKPDWADPNNATYLGDQAVALHVHATILQDVHQNKAAEATYVKAIELLDGLAKRFPAALEHPTKAAVSRHNLAILIEDDGRIDESERMHRLNLKFWEEMAASEPSNPNNRSKVALTLESLAVLLEKTGRKAEAEPVIRRGVLQRAALTKDYPNTPHYFMRLAGSLGTLAKLTAERGDLAEARRFREEALSARRAAALALAPGNAEFIKETSFACNDLLETLIRLNEHEPAAKIAAELVSLAPDSGNSFCTPAQAWPDVRDWRRRTSGSPRPA